jgi:hypothetical protein
MSVMLRLFALLQAVWLARARKLSTDAQLSTSRFAHAIGAIG